MDGFNRNFVGEPASVIAHFSAKRAKSHDSSEIETALFVSLADLGMIHVIVRKMGTGSESNQCLNCSSAPTTRCLSPFCERPISLFRR